MLKRLYRILIFPYTIWFLYLMFFGFGREMMSENVVRLVPIASTVAFVEHRLMFGKYMILLINILGNVAMFMPFGFLAWRWKKYGDWKTLLVHFLMVIITIEAMQYFSRMGVFDVDDILLNILGVWLGFRLREFLDKYFFG